MAETMRAVVFEEPGRMELREVAVPKPGPGEVLIKVAACGVCGTDAHVFEGRFPAKFPLIPGHEFSGEVVEVGEGVSEFKPGDKVAVDPNIACWRCDYCRVGKRHLCKNWTAIGLHRAGGYAEYCSIPVEQAVPVPPEMPLEHAALAEPVACCLHGVDLLDLKAGDTVAIMGMGTIGLIMLQLVRHRGASKILAFEPSEGKRKLALELGADWAEDPLSVEPREAVRERFGDGADVVIECAGSQKSAEVVLDLVRPGGVVMFFGVLPPEFSIPLRPFWVYKNEVTIKGSFVNPFTESRAIALLASGVVKAEPLISHRMPLSDLKEALRMLGAPEVRRMLIIPSM